MVVKQWVMVLYRKCTSGWFVHKSDSDPEVQLTELMIQLSVNNLNVGLSHKVIIWLQKIWNIAQVIWTHVWYFYGVFSLSWKPLSSFTVTSWKRATAKFFKIMFHRRKSFRFGKTWKWVNPFSFLGEIFFFFLSPFLFINWESLFSLTQVPSIWRQSKALTKHLYWQQLYHITKREGEKDEKINER